MGKKKLLVWIAGSVLLFLALTALTVLILVAVDAPRPTKANPVNNDTGKVQEVVPTTDAKAEELKTDAQKALSAQKFDEAREKYQQAKTIYEAADNQVYVSDIDMQLDLVEQQKQVQEKLNSQTSDKGGQLAPSDRQ